MVRACTGNPALGSCKNLGLAQSFHLGYLLLRLLPRLCTPFPNCPMRPPALNTPGYQPVDRRCTEHYLLPQGWVYRGGAGLLPLCCLVPAP